MEARFFPVRERGYKNATEKTTMNSIHSNGTWVRVNNMNSYFFDIHTDR